MHKNLMSLLGSTLLVLASACNQGGAPGQPGTDGAQDLPDTASPGRPSAGAPPDAGTDTGTPTGSTSDAGVPASGGTTPDGGVTGTPPPPAFLRELYVSLSGSDTASGTATAPLRTIGRAVSIARPGDRITVRAGTYAERIQLTTAVAAGTATSPIRLQGEGMPRLVLPSGETHTLLTIARPYWQVHGFEVDMQGKAAYAAAFTGVVTGSVLSGSNLHHGTSGAGVSTHHGATGATIEGNEIHHFVKSGQDSHGVIVQPTSRNITVRGNRIHDNSGDSIQCLGPEGFSNDTPADSLLIENNVMWADYEQAVDIKTCTNVTVRGNTMRDYLDSPGGCSMVVHMSAANVIIEDNLFANVGKALAIGGNRVGPVPTNISVRRNRFRNVVKGTGLDGVAIKVEGSEGVRVLHNTLLDVDATGISAGGGTGGPTSNMTVKNNILQVNAGARAISLGSSTSNFLSRSNLVPVGAQFAAPDSSGSYTQYSLADWQARGHDGATRQGDAQLAVDTLAPGAAAVDWAENIGWTHCGAGPDVGAVETGC